MGKCGHLLDSLFLEALIQPYLVINDLIWMFAFRIIHSEIRFVILNVPVNQAGNILQPLGYGNTFITPKYETNSMYVWHIQTEFRIQLLFLSLPKNIQTKESKPQLFMGSHCDVYRILLALLLTHIPSLR